MTTAVLSAYEPQISLNSPPAMSQSRSPLVSRRAKAKNVGKLTVAVPSLRVRRGSQAPLSAIDLRLRVPHPMGRQEVIGTLSAHDSEFTEDKYSTGPIAILPNLYLGSERNASNVDIIKSLSIRFILNVAKEVENPLFSKIFPTETQPTMVSETAPYIPRTSPLSPRLASFRHEPYRNHPRSRTPSPRASRASSPKLPSSPLSRNNYCATDELDFSSQSLRKLSIYHENSSPVASPTTTPVSLRSTSESMHSTTSAKSHLSKNSESTMYAIETPKSSNYPFPISDCLLEVETPSSYGQLSPSTASTPSTARMPFVKPHYRKLNWEHNEEISKQLREAFEYIEEARKNNQAILINCQQGVSRSATLVIAYTMKTLKLSLRDAYTFVKSRSPHICPNMALMTQLAEYELALHGQIEKVAK